MAGSITARVYTDDNGSRYRVRVDKSNADSVGGFLSDLTALLQAGNKPSGLEMRYVNAYLSSDPRVKRRFYVGNLTRFTDLLSMQTPGFEAPPYPNMAAETWRITSSRGEGRTFTVLTDTNITDTAP